MDSTEMEEINEQQWSCESHTETSESDDSQDDPSFDILEETQSRFSNLSLKKKSKSRVVKELDENDPDVIELVLPKLEEVDEKSYENIQKIILGGNVEKLKVEQCKVYLRKHGLRLTGNKETLIQRIKEHLDFMEGGGEKKYPVSRFTLNCKGDACMGDVVIFEQNVYGTFPGPPSGTRMVAGRIVRESYGAAKQQHTFTIEVLWSKGEKPLPPLHQLLVKGRNLYRLKTMRQPWKDEMERQKILSEKHARGSLARSSREARVLQREMRQLQKSNWEIRTEQENRKQEGRNRNSADLVPMRSEKLGDGPQQHQQGTNYTAGEQNFQQKRCCSSGTTVNNISVQPQVSHVTPNNLPNVSVSRGSLNQTQPLATSRNTVPRSPSRRFPNNQHMNHSRNLTQGSFHDEDHVKSSSSIRSPHRGHFQNHGYGSNIMVQRQIHSLQGHDYAYNMCSKPVKNPVNNRGNAHHRHEKFIDAGRNPGQGWGQEQKQICRFYAQGRCYYGYRCKYLHENAGN